MIIKKFNKKSGVSLIVSVLGLVTILACAGLAVDLGMVIVARQELQKAAEASALSGVSVLEPSMDSSGVVSISPTDLNNTINDVFNTIKSENSVIASASPTNIEYKHLSKAVRVTATANAGTYFLGVLGIKSITVQARASAINFPVYLDPKIPKTPTIGSVLTASPKDILINSTTPIDNIYYAPDGKFTQTTGGGYITIRLPAPIVDLPNTDLFVSMINVQGYYIYIGTDVDPQNPYVSADNPGAGIKWVNISATGAPVSGSPTSGPAGVYQSDVTYDDGGFYMIRQPKFYGSGVFDIGKKAYDTAGNMIYDGSVVKTARYIKIVDDCNIDFICPHTLIDKGSTSPSAGVKVDAVGVLHHARLIRNADFDKDTDGDGAIDILETMMHSDPNNANSDNFGATDGAEFVGWDNNAHSPITQTGSTRPRIDSPICANP